MEIGNVMLPAILHSGNIIPRKSGFSSSDQKLLTEC